MKYLKCGLRAFAVCAFVVGLSACVNQTQRDIDNLANNLIEQTELGGVTRTPAVTTVSRINIDKEESWVILQSRVSPVIDGPAIRLVAAYRKIGNDKQLIQASLIPHATSTQVAQEQMIQVLSGFSSGAAGGLFSRPPKASAVVGVDQKVTVGSRSLPTFELDPSKVSLDRLTAQQRATLESGGALSFDAYVVERSDGTKAVVAMVAS